MLKKEDPKRINVLLKQLIKHWGIENKFLESQIITNWDKFVGAPIANQTNKLYIKNGVLYVHTESPIAKRELNIIKPALIEMINMKLEQKIIKSIIIY